MRDLIIEKQNSDKLAAYLFEAIEPIYLVVICHGFRGGKENGGKLYTFAEKLRALGLSVLAFDFSGSGQSDGDFTDVTLTRQAEDLREVMAYAKKETGLPMILLGRSFGGSTVLAGGCNYPEVVGYIFWSTPVHMESTFAGMIPAEYPKLKNCQATIVEDPFGNYRLGPDIIADFANHDMDHYLEEIGNRPVLVIQAVDDPIVDPTNAAYIKERSENCDLEIIEEAGHRFLEKITLREDMTMDWLRKTFDLKS